MKTTLVLLSCFVLYHQCKPDIRTDRARNPTGCKKPTGNRGEIFYQGCKKFECVKQKRKFIWKESPANRKCCFMDNIGYQAGKIFYRGCKQFECVKNGNRFIWKDSPASNRCCFINNLGYPVGTLIFSKTTADDCTTSSLMCEKKGKVSSLKILIENKCPFCPKTATAKTEILTSPTATIVTTKELQSKTKMTVSTTSSTSVASTATITTSSSTSSNSETTSAMAKTTTPTTSKNITSTTITSTTKASTTTNPTSTTSTTSSSTTSTASTTTSSTTSTTSTTASSTTSTTNTTTTTPTTTTSTSTITYFLDVVIRLTGIPTQAGWFVKPGQVDAIDLTSSSDILMRGISLFGSLSGSDIRNGKIQLKETASRKIIISENFQFTSNGKGDYFDHIFSSPGNVKAGVKYTVTVEYDDTQKIYRAEGGFARTTAACNGKTVHFAFSFSKDDSNGSGPTRGQIPRILISC